jgi:hypothetical protein
MHPRNSSCIRHNCALKSTGKETFDFSDTHTFRSYYLATCYGPDSLGFEPLLASGYPFSTAIQTSPCAYPASCTMGNGALILGMKQPQHDADHPVPSRAQPKNEERYTCAIPVPAWHVTRSYLNTYCLHICVTLHVFIIRSTSHLGI